MELKLNVLFLPHCDTAKLRLCHGYLSCLHKSQENGRCISDGSSGTGKEDAAPAAASGDADANGRLAAPQGDADDLKQIKGVGPAFEKKLNDAGVFHFWQIASMTDDQLAALEEEVGTSGKGADWKAEAEALQG